MMTRLPRRLSGHDALTDHRCGTCVPDPVAPALPGSRVFACTARLSATPDTVSGAAAFDPARASARMRGEAVERAAAWHGEPVPPPAACSADITPQFDPAAQRSGTHTTVRELTPTGWGAAASVDTAAVLLGTAGWFPHGSAGLAAGPRFASAGPDSAALGSSDFLPAAVGTEPTGDPTLSAAVWELLERDAVTRWWRGELSATRIAVPAAVEAAAGSSCRIELISIARCCRLAEAVDPQTGWRTVGAAAGPDPQAACLKAAEEAIVSLAALHRLTAAPFELLGVRPRASHRYLDLPPRECPSLAHTLLTLADERFSQAVAARFAAAAPAPEEPAPGEPEPDSSVTAVSDNPVARLHAAGHRIWAVQLRSPETAATDSIVWRALSPTTLAPLPRSAYPDELPVPLT